MTDRPTNNRTLPLFDEQDTHKANLERVKGNIGTHIMAFVRRHFESGAPFFHAEELHKYVKAEANIAPASADRVLRQLRLDGAIGYRVVSRSKSLYEVTYVEGCDE